MQLNRLHTMLKDDRKDLRVREDGQIPWQIKYKQRKGVAKLRNISISGMLVETDAPFTQKDECIFSFESDPDAGIYIPQIGRLIWHKKKKFSHKKYLSGIKFLEADEQVLTKMRSKVQIGVDKFVKQKRFTIIAGSVLSAAFIGIIGYMMWFGTGIYRDVTTANEMLVGASGQQIVLSQTYNNLYRSSEIKLAQAEERLAIADQLIKEDQAAIALFSEELEATKALLDQTETMLIQSNDRNVELRNEIGAIGQGQIASSPGAVAGGQEIMSVADAQSLMSTYRERIQSAKNEIRRLKANNRETRLATIAQIDEQKLQVGNNGYFVRDGNTVKVDVEQYQNLTAAQSQKIVTSPNTNVEIDVTFFE